MERVFNLWFLIRPAADVPGQWTSHCLELDVVSQGTSLAHALDMGVEAAFQAIVDDIDDGLDPRDRPRAPREHWDALFSVVNSGEQVTMKEVHEDGSRLESFAALIEVHVNDEATTRDWDAPVLKAIPAAVSG